jgi:hydroxymethylpyrimidine/phosphomethylpyrimidine kinase
MKRVLTIAGSDSERRPGIQADLKTVAALGGYGDELITALTAQNTLGVRGIHGVPPDFVRLQLDAVLEDIGADAAKTGMLAGRKSWRPWPEALWPWPGPLVVDTGHVSASGSALLTPDAVNVIKSRLLPLARDCHPQPVRGGAADRQSGPHTGKR